MSDLGRVVVISEHAQQALRLAAREAVNKSAHLVTIDARRRVQAVVGADQRMSGVIYRQRNGKRSRVTAETIGKGGTRINPYYRDAYSTTRPVALVAARGPAHYVEHPRRGGYPIRPRPALASGAADAASFLGRALGYTPAEAATAARRHTRPALNTPQGPRAAATGGAVANPAAPITKAFRDALRTVYRPATDTIDQAMTKVWH